MKWSKRDRARLDAIDRIYAELPTVACRGKCGLACGPIPLTDLEARRIQAAGGRKPRTLPVVHERASERCVYLTEQGRCSVYAARPLICRAYATVKMLSCPWGCLPDRWLSDLEYLDIAQRIEALGGGRVLVTTPEGLTALPDSYSHIVPQRSAEAIEADAERTRTSRAIHGGRTITVVTHER